MPSSTVADQPGGVRKVIPAESTCSTQGPGSACSPGAVAGPRSAAGGGDGTLTGSVCGGGWTVLASDGASATGCPAAALGSGGRSDVGMLGSRPVCGTKRGCGGGRVRSGLTEVLGDAAGGGSVTVCGCSIEAEVSGRSVRGEAAGAGSGDGVPRLGAPTAPTLLISGWNKLAMTSLSAGRQNVPTIMLWSETVYPAKTTRRPSSPAPIFPVTAMPDKPKVLVNGSLLSRW